MLSIFTYNVYLSYLNVNPEKQGICPLASPEDILFDFRERGRKRERERERETH